MNQVNSDDKLLHHQKHHQEDFLHEHLHHEHLHHGHYQQFKTDNNNSMMNLIFNSNIQNESTTKMNFIESSNSTEFQSLLPLNNHNNDSMSDFSLMDLSSLMRHSLSVSIILCIAYIIVFVIGIVGNCFVVAIVFRTPRMRTVTNFFIVNLAFADILVLLFCLPATLISNLLIPWIFGIFMCKAVSYLQGVAVSASINTLVAVSVDRFLAICYPFRCQMSRRCARRVIIIIWLFSSIVAFPWALYFQLRPIDTSIPELMLCSEQWPDESSEITYFIVANLCLFYLIPLCAITACYLAIWVKVWRRIIPGEQPKGLGNQLDYLLQRSKIKTVKMFVVVVIIFALSWLPLYCIFAIIKLGGQIEGNSLKEQILMIAAPLAQWLGSSNSCINPILYCFFNKKYRNGFVAVLKSKKCCGRIHYEEPSGTRRHKSSARSITRGTTKLTMKLDSQCDVVSNLTF